MEREFTLALRIIFVLLMALAWQYLIFGEEEVPGTLFSNTTEVMSDGNRQ
jgi:hypothetical protein